MSRPGDDIDFPQLPEERAGDLALDAGAVLAGLANLIPGLAPMLAGAVSNVLRGWSLQRKLDRVSETLLDVAVRLTDLRADVREDYVRSDEFEDLLDQTLRRVANERHKEKRRVYREVLVGALTSTNTTYDEQLRMLLVLDQVQVCHFRVLRSMADREDPTLPGLRHRLPNMSHELIVDLVDQLDSLGVVKISPDGKGATLTPFGKRFASLIRAGEGKNE